MTDADSLDGLTDAERYASEVRRILDREKEEKLKREPREWAWYFSPGRILWRVKFYCRYQTRYFWQPYCAFPRTKLRKVLFGPGYLVYRNCKHPVGNKWLYWLRYHRFDEQGWHFVSCYYCSR